MTYKNWFDNEIKHMKMIGSDSFIAMIWSLPLFVWVPILPIIVINYVTDKKYLTARWMF
jgi:hypothetical protein